MSQKIIIYEQFSQNTIESPRDYYDPNVMMSTRNFCIRPGEEVLIIISGNGYKWMDDSIFQLVHDEEVDSYFAEMGSQQLSLIVKNCSCIFTIYIGYKTPLKFLLDMPRTVSKLCYSSILDLSYAKSKSQNDDDEKFANDGTIFIM
jgi:hypothetical protein